MKETLTERMRHAAAHVELYDQEWEAQQLRDGAAEIDRLRAALIEARKAHVLRTWDEDALTIIDTALTPNVKVTG